VQSQKSTGTTFGANTRAAFIGSVRGQIGVSTMAKAFQIRTPVLKPISISSGALPQKFADRNEVVASAKNPTEGEVGEAVQRASRHDLVRALAPRYGHVGKSEKGQILDQVCEVTGYTRKYALTLLTDPPADEPQVK